MGGEWETASLGDLVDDVLDRRGVTPLKLGSDFTTTGHRVISAKAIKEKRVDLSADEPRFVDGATYRKWMRTPLLADDVVLTSEAPLGEPAYIAHTTEWCLGQRLFGIRTKKNSLHGRFLFYALQSDRVRHDLLSRATGTTAQGIRQTELRLVQIPVPTLSEQRAIAHILGTLDDKIELNRRMSETLEAMARALFNSWSQNAVRDRVAVAELISTAVLEIGDGYRAKNSELGSPGLPFIRAGDLNNGFDTKAADTLRADGVSRAGGKVSRPGDVAFTSKGTIGRFARVTDRTQQFVYSPQVCYWRTLDPTRLHPAVLYCWMQNADLNSQIMAVAGQTDMAPYVSLRDQRKMTMPIFESDQNAFGERLEILLDRKALAEAESRTLAALRDALLPKLISGELRVKDAEKFVAKLA